MLHDNHRQVITSRLKQLIISISQFPADRPQYTGIEISRYRNMQYDVADTVHSRARLHWLYFSPFRYHCCWQL